VSLEENKAIVRRWIEAENKKDLAVLGELMAADYFDPSMPVRGREGAKQLMAMVSKAFPDYHETIEDIIAEGNKVWTRIKVTQTHTGEFEFLGSTFAPTGKKITITSIVIWRIVDGKVVESRGVSDMLDFYKQLGIIEYTEKGKKLFPEDAK